MNLCIKIIIFYINLNILLNKLTLDDVHSSDPAHSGGPARHSAAAARTHHNAGTRQPAARRRLQLPRSLLPLRPLRFVDALSGPLDDACQLLFSLAVLLKLILVYF